MATVEEIIATAKTKESWNVTHEWNYGPIDYLYHELVEKCAPKPKEVTEAIMMFEKYVHKVTDAETYFVWEHCKFDVRVDADYLVCAMLRTFPKVSFETVCEWIRKHQSPHQYDNGISKALVPKEYLEKHNV